MKHILILLLVFGFAAINLVGCEKEITDSMMDVIEPSDTPTMDDPEAFTVALVQAAVDLYKTEGREAAIAHYNDSASVQGQWYVFITDENDLFVTHPTLPDLIGTDLKTLVGSDGNAFGVEIAKATDDGRWIDYLWANPETNKLEQKRTWAIRHDGYLFGSGYYEPWGPDPATLPEVSKDDPKAYAVSLVHKAIARYEFEGRDATVAYYNDPANIDGQWYVFITDETDIYVAHASKPEFVGTDIKEIPGLDGSPLGAEIAKATVAGLWIEYLWPNPESGENELKRTWAIRHDGYLFASGYYESATEDSETHNFETVDY